MFSPCINLKKKNLFFLLFFLLGTSGHHTYIGESEIEPQILIWIQLLL